MKTKKKTINMQRTPIDREIYGPEFDDRLIQMVRDNPAIYDVNHPHYRRNHVRIAIWERIAYELGARSKFVQTKWKNIRYNYLQELKSNETGIVNVNIRKRRFTEDLSFLQNTAQTYNMRKGSKKTMSRAGSDNDSNSYLYNDINGSHAYEVIEIEHSDDGGGDGSCEDDELFDVLNRGSADVAGLSYNDPEDNMTMMSSTTATAAVTAASPKSEQSEKELLEDKHMAPNKIHIENVRSRSRTAGDATPTSTTTVAAAALTVTATSTASPQHVYDASSPLLTPMVVLGSNGDCVTDNAKQQNHLDAFETRTSQHYRRESNKQTVPEQRMFNAARRKAMAAPFPVLTPINDPIELYCLSLVDSLRSMPRSERERVKYEFAKILKDAKYSDES